MPSAALQVGGLVPMTTVDFPDRLSAVVFCQGCPLRCRYCHNGSLLPRHGGERIPWQRILDFLDSRRGLLDAVVFSGGEPTQQRALPAAIESVRAMGFDIGLHTAGVYPERLRQLLPLLDWVGLDVKALPADYEALTGMAGSGELAWHSAQLLVESGLPHELRTTWHPKLMDPRDRQRMGDAVSALGSANHVWQACRGGQCLDPAL